MASSSNLKTRIFATASLLDVKTNKCYISQLVTSLVMIRRKQNEELIDWH